MACDHNGIFMRGGLFAFDCVIDLTRDEEKVGELHRYVCQGCGASHVERVIFKPKDEGADGKGGK